MNVHIPIFVFSKLLSPLDFVDLLDLLYLLDLSSPFLTSSSTYYNKLSDRLANSARVRRVIRMYASVLSILLMGMLPVQGVRHADALTLRDVHIAAPSPYLAAARGTALTFPKALSASGVLVIDFDSGQALLERDAKVPRPMASLTKLMTALIIVEEHDLDEWVTIPKGMSMMNGSVAYLPEGEQFTVGDLLSAALMASANDAAQTLAIFHSGSVSAFVQDMNDRARSLGLRQTSFANPIGLDDDHQWSTPRDVAWLASFAMRNPEIRTRMSTRGARIASKQGTPIYLTHTHAFLHAATGVIAGKTGTTNGANECLMSLVEKADRTYLVILMNSLTRYKDMRALLDALDAPSVSQSL